MFLLIVENRKVIYNSLVFPDQSYLYSFLL